MCKEMLEKNSFSPFLLYGLGFLAFFVSLSTLIYTGNVSWILDLQVIRDFRIFIRLMKEEDLHVCVCHSPANPSIVMSYSHLAYGPKLYQEICKYITESKINN